MAKKQKSFADKAAGNVSGESVYVKYVKSVQSEKTRRWRFNEQMIRMNKGEQLDAALKRIDEAANLIDIDLSEFEHVPEVSSDTTLKTNKDQTDDISVSEVTANESSTSDGDIISTDESSSEEE